MKLVTILLPEAYLEGLETLVETGLYPSRSAAIRFAVHDLLRNELWQTVKEEDKEEATSARRKSVRIEFQSSRPK